MHERAHAPRAFAASGWAGGAGGSRGVLVRAKRERACRRRGGSPKTWTTLRYRRSGLAAWALGPKTRRTRNVHDGDRPGKVHGSGKNWEWENWASAWPALQPALTIEPVVRNDQQRQRGVLGAGLEPTHAFLLAASTSPRPGVCCSSLALHAGCAAALSSPSPAAAAAPRPAHFMPTLPRRTTGTAAFPGEGVTKACAGRGADGDWLDIRAAG